MRRRKTSARGHSARETASVASDGELDPESHSNESNPMDYELFNRSVSPNEFAYDADDSLWPVKGIVDEELDLFGNSIYQIEWEGWSRADGTTTTWEKALSGPNTILRSWRTVQTKKRRQEASKQPDIDLEVIGSFMPHNIRTAERACAYAEKLKAWPVPSFDDWDKELRTVNRDSIPNKAPRGSGKRKREESNQSAHHPVSISLLDEDDLAPTSIGGASGSSQPSSTLDTIWDVESRWNAAAITEGASNIRIINEIDDTSPVDSDFIYLESSREYMVSIQKPEPGFLTGCDCTDGCRSPLLCSCLMESQCIDEDDNPCPAYDKKGLFLFTNRREVVECNMNCTCRRCSNNVAQRPRRIPLEVFKTLKHGWGVRPTVFVPSGTVLGIFTGSVIKRKSVADLGPEEKKYCFDLDTRDDDPNFNGYPKYSMLAHSTGNWSRFLNHSCGPTAKVYSVVIDTTLRANMPYLAFVACQDIPPRKEITIDYNPRGHSMILEEKKGKGKRKMASNRMPCDCGSEMCRGFIY